MARTTTIFGVLLVLLGLGAYGVALAGDDASVTALIPAFLGIPVTILGVVAQAQPKRRALLLHVAVALAVLGFLGAARGLMGLPALLTGGDVERPAAVIVQSIMAALCAVYVVLAIQSFLAARSARADG